MNWWRTTLRPSKYSIQIVDPFLRQNRIQEQIGWVLWMKHSSSAWWPVFRFMNINNSRSASFLLRRWNIYKPFLYLYVFIHICIYKYIYDFFLLAPVPLSIFRSNSKFDENSKHPGVKYTRPITTIFCTRHDSVTVVTCAKYCCDRSSIFETRAFWIFIEFRIRSKYA